MTNNSKSKQSKYGYLLILSALALVQWLISRITGTWTATEVELDQQAKQHQHEIESLQIQQEQAKLDLRKVRIKQRELKQELPEGAPGATIEQLSTTLDLPVSNGRTLESVR